LTKPYLVAGIPTLLHGIPRVLPVDAGLEDKFLKRHSRL